MRRPSPWLVLVVVLFGAYILREPRLQQMEDVFLNWFMEHAEGILPPAQVTLVEIGREDFERLTPLVRSRARYRTSLQVLRRAKELSPNMVTKSGVMLGLGETESELFQTMDDLREAGCQVLTLGQYLRPSPKHLPVLEYVTPEQFDLYGEIARKKGFDHVASGPLVRSSYHAADFHPVVRR